MLDPKQFARMVRFHRKHMGLSQQALAELAGVGKTVIFDIEHAKATVRMDSVSRVCDALNIKVRLESPVAGVWKAFEAGE